MKKIFTFYLVLLTFVTAYGQSPNKISYQAVVRNSSNALVVNQAIGMRLSILQGSTSGTVVYAETQVPVSNTNGLVSLEIGGGVVVSGDFATINWLNGPYFIKTETDPAGGTNYTVIGTTQLLSVPYALHAKTAESIAGGMSNLVLPTITNSVASVTSNSATFSGNISNANNSQITERGFVYSTTPNPTVLNNKIVVGNGIGSFSFAIDYSYRFSRILTSGTNYYMRAYAITENQIVLYGNQISFSTLPTGQAGQAGGIVFFDKGVNTNGWRYLEVMTSDVSSVATWGCYGTSIPGLLNTVGSGEQNTNLIVAGCGDLSISARLCYDLNFGGQSDWFLPSRDEFYLIYKNLFVNGMGNLGNAVNYLISTEVNGFFGEKYNMNTVGEAVSSDYKNISGYKTRAIRAY